MTTTRKIALVLLPLSAIAAILFVALAFSFPSRKIEIVYQTTPELGDQIIIRFPNWVEEDRAKKAFRITPTIPGEIVWLEEYKELHFVPSAGFSSASSFTVSAKLDHPLLASLTPVGTSRSIVAQTASPELPRQEYYVPPITTGKYIDVNINTMILTLFENGKVLKTFPVAGKGNPWAHPTIEGTFSVKSKEPKHLSSISRVWMPWSLRVHGNYYLHGIPYWPNGKKLTSKYSHGCVRLFDEGAKEIYDFAEIETPVVIHSTSQKILASPESIIDGDLVREAGNPHVYIVKHSPTKRFKRHVLTEKFSQWYPHLAPFSAKVKVVPAGTLTSYIESRWVRSSALNSFIYEISSDAVKHKMVCSAPENCNDAWALYGWDPDEIYTINTTELSYYREGESLLLPRAPVSH